MKYWKVGLIFFIAFLIQSSLLNVISIEGYTPNLLLSLTIAFSFCYEERLYYLIFPMIFGVLHDICLGAIVGSTSIALLLVAILVLAIREFANVENVISLWVSSVVAFVIYFAVNWGILHISGNPIGIAVSFRQFIFVALYSMVVVTILYIVFMKSILKHRRDRYFK